MRCGGKKKCHSGLDIITTQRLPVSGVGSLHKCNKTKCYFLPFFSEKHLHAGDIRVALCKGEVAKLWTPSLGWGGAEPCSSWVSATAGAGGCWHGRVSPKSHRDPVSISKGKGDPHLRHRFCWVPLMSLWGMSGGGHFAWVREDFCFSCQVEEIWMEQWLPLSRQRLRASSLGWPCCWGRGK